jgi:hypothetical protein
MGKIQKKRFWSTSLGSETIPTGLAKKQENRSKTGQNSNFEFVKLETGLDWLTDWFSQFIDRYGRYSTVF